MVKSLMKRVTARRGGRLPRFMCVLGDGASDNILFETVHSLLAAAPTHAMLCDLKLFTMCGVSTTQSPAQFFVKDESEVALLLRSLVGSGDTELATPAPAILTRSRTNSRARELEA